LDAPSISPPPKRRRQPPPPPQQQQQAPHSTLPSSSLLSDDDGDDGGEVGAIDLGDGDVPPGDGDDPPESEADENDDKELEKYEPIEKGENLPSIHSLQELRAGEKSAKRLISPISVQGRLFRKNLRLIRLIFVLDLSQEKARLVVAEMAEGAAEEDSTRNLVANFGEARRKTLLRKLLERCSLQAVNRSGQLAPRSFSYITHTLKDLTLSSYYFSLRTRLTQILRCKQLAPNTFVYLEKNGVPVGPGFRARSMQSPRLQWLATRSLLEWLHCPPHPAPSYLSRCLRAQPLHLPREFCGTPGRDTPRGG
jgi:hypothetical protein